MQRGVGGEFGDGTQGDSCVEVALTQRAICVRDSKDLARPHFAVGRDGWTSFVRYAAYG
ncbi:DUF397 domain-containing protein [Streptomyces sp. SID12501]|uniref:DUF397 domain-containing protein n=1 Tax=Streptomyces sp. SID12501 TaxID=2706042 RepID=A0A6B3BH47_9ACTN|nr:DUF397 domain-containing protein [Streptomyces sp. SID12501]